MSESSGAYAEPTSNGVKDFTRKHEQITFQVDGDVFEAARALPGKTLTQFAKRYQELGALPADQQVDAILGALELVLLPESAARIDKRLGDLANPIELEQALEIIMWLLERYGLRPTQPSSNSAAGPDSPVSGTNSTDAPPQPVPASQTSPQTVS